MLVRLLAAAFAVAASAAPSAQAGPCFGTRETALVCVDHEHVVVDPDGGAPVGDCVYVHSQDCTDVFVPTPSATTTGPLLRYPCGTVLC